MQIAHCSDRRQHAQGSTNLTGYNEMHVHLLCNYSSVKLLQLITWSSMNEAQLLASDT